MIEKICVTPVGSLVELATLNTANMDLLPSRGTTTVRTGTAQSSTHPPFQYDPSKGIRKPGPTDVICGRGKMTFQDGDVYEGEFKNGKKHVLNSNLN